MEAGACGVLAHHPGVRVAHFFDGMRGEANKFGIPSRGLRVAARDALANLHERMLDVARVLVVRQVLRDLLIGKLAAEPGVPPKKERKQHDEPRGEIKKQARARGHAVVGFLWRRT